MFIFFMLFVFFHSQLRVLSSLTIPNQAKEEYDYVIIGGGTAGCPLAATLSSNFKVLLLERGADPQTFPSVLTLDGVSKAFSDEDDGASPFQRFTSEDGVENTRARILGGGTMINFGIYSRAEPEFFEKSGVEWDMEMVEKAYQWVEETVVSQKNISLWQSVFKEALLEAGVVPDNGFTLEHVVGTKTTGSIFDSEGKRHGAVELLNKANPTNLKVAIQATVERIIFSKTSSGLSASGVLYSDANGKLHRAFIRNKGEIILSAGALGSPQLLLLSGIGPKSHLSSLKLHVVLDQPFVGQFMVDDPRYGAYMVLPFETTTDNAQVIGILDGNLYIESIASTIPFSSPRLFALFPRHSSSLNLTVAFLIGKFSDVVSTGSLRLASSTDVKKNPTVRFNYLKDPYDLARCVKGTKKIGDMIRTEVLEKLKTQNLQGVADFKYLGLPLPENMSDDAAVGAFCRETVATFWHYHGGCLVGKVVDGDYRVVGIRNLRAVDSSTFLSTPGTNPMPTIMMLGRYIGLKMVQERLGQTCQRFEY